MTFCIARGAKGVLRVLPARPELAPPMTWGTRSLNTVRDPAPVAPLASCIHEAWASIKPDVKQITSYVLAASMLAQGCAGRTNITSQPAGAKLFIDGSEVGETPYRYRDKKIIGSQTEVRLEMPGYQTLNTSFSRDEELHVGALVGGLFLWPMLLWVTTYKDNHHYTMQPQQAAGAGAAIPAPGAPPAQPAPQGQAPQSDAPAAQIPPAPQAAPGQPAVKSKADRLLELEALKEQKLISDQEYATQRQRILDEH